MVVLKWIPKLKGPRTANETLKKKNKVGGPTSPDFEICAAAVSRTVWYGVETDRRVSGTKPRNGPTRM